MTLPPRDKKGRFAAVHDFDVLRAEGLNNAAPDFIGSLILGMVLGLILVALAWALGSKNLTHGAQPKHENPEAAGHLSQSGEIDKGQGLPPVDLTESGGETLAVKKAHASSFTVERGLNPHSVAPVVAPALCKPPVASGSVSNRTNKACAGAATSFMRVGIKAIPAGRNRDAGSIPASHAPIFPPDAHYDVYEQLRDCGN